MEVINLDRVAISGNEPGLYERIKSYNEKVRQLLEDLNERNNLSDDEAIDIANNIVNNIKMLAEDNIASGKRLETDPQIFSALYRGAADAYVLASEKVDPSSRIGVASPANYWNMLADQAESIQMGIKIVKKGL